MKINFTDIPSQYQPQISKIVYLYFKKHNINPASFINIGFISKTKIQTLNNKYRRINKPTDVLSFPIWGNIKIIPREGQITLGDIYICPEMTDLDKELEYLVEHSLNHLVGKHHQV